MRASKDEGERLNAEKISWNHSSLILRPSFRLVALLSLAFAGTAYAASAEGSAQTFLWIAIILIAARVAALVERFGQSAVLGELIVGVLLGNLSLVGIQFLEPIIADPILDFLAQLGVVIKLPISNSYIPGDATELWQWHQDVVNGRIQRR